MSFVIPVKDFVFKEHKLILGYSLLFILVLAEGGRDVTI
jgi:hypothetical protein